MKENRIDQCFARLKTQNKKALIPYITAGDSNPSITVPLMHQLVKSGADIIELGVPFSDPMADGPTIQLACERALVHNTSLSDILEMVKEFRTKDAVTPIVLMGYLNPIEAMGYQKFADNAMAAGIDGALIVDLPPEEASDLIEIMNTSGLATIFLLSPTSNDERITKITNAGSGYLYYVSLKGVTGSNALNMDEVSSKVNHIREFTDLPLGVGFGIKDAETAALVSKTADAIIVGSAIVKIIEENSDDADTINREIGELVSSMRTAIDA